MPPLILVTNDDGVRSVGIEALARELGTLGEVYVVAPQEEKSAVSHALTIHDPVRIRKLDERVFAVRGTPADCVIIAVRKILPRHPDLVVSGINNGGNIGDDVMYSGTVAAAREACYLDIPAFAVSQLYVDEPADVTVAARFSRALSERILAEGLPRGTFLNVNVPPSGCTCVRWTRQGVKLSKSNVYENLDPRRRKYYWIGEDRQAREWGADPGSDHDAIQQGCISVTPLHRDQTDYEALEKMAEHDLLQVLTSSLLARE